MPGGTRGSPTAPRRMASVSRSALELLVRAALAGAQVPLGAEIELDQLDLKPSRTASRTLSASRTTSGPVPSPG